MAGALPRSPAYDDSVAPPWPAGILAHLDVVYGFALTLTGDAECAGELTEAVFGSVHDDLWSTLGGHGPPRPAGWPATPALSAEHYRAGAR